MALQVDAVDLQRLEVVWGTHFVATLHKMAEGRKQFGLRLIAGSLADYRRGTAVWWDEVEEQIGDGLRLRPIYFVSSNTHSLVNLMTGFARRESDTLIRYMESRGREDLLAEYQAIQQDGGATILDNFLYYVLKKFLSDGDPAGRQRFNADESEIGIHRIPSRHGFEIETQVIEIGKLRVDWLDERLVEGTNCAVLPNSDALIVNIDYPLGMAAYEMLARVTERVERVLGVYVMGKAATLNGRLGDVMIPNVVHDEHSQNTYLFSNCFSAQDVAPYLTTGTVLDNQKAISARGTFLQNPRYMSVFYHEGYTIIEMEGGPYLSSVYEAVRPIRHPQNEIVTLYGAPFDVGLMYYASDTPLSKGHNLGAGSLSYAGVEPTYASAVAILRRILNREAQRIRARTDHIAVSN
jgi:hypothetical protein